MASVSCDKAGRRTVQFIGPDRKRRTVRLGKASRKSADTARRHIEQLNTARTIPGATVPDETARWVRDLEAVLFDKLVAVGLVRQRKAVALQAFITDYIAHRTDVKPATREIWGQGERGLVDFFGGDKLVRDITAGAADNYKMHLIGEKLAPMTVRKRLQFAKTIFRAAQKHRLIDASPFAEVKAQAAMPSDRQHFITPDDTAKLLAACPNWEWRLIVALARYGGLRCPSEVLSLRVGDINWEANRVCVTSPKTEHHPGKGSRMVPLFPELRPYLDEAFDAVPEGVEYILERFRQRAIGPKGWRGCNLRTTMEKIVKRAGLVPWPRLFHNMRASRETELSERFPIKVVTSWIGNTPDIAMDHYLQVTDEHWQRALEGDGKGPAADQSEQPPCSALQNPVQSVAVLAGTGEYENEGIPGKTRFPGDARRPETDGEGFEPPLDFRLEQFSRLPP